MPVKNISLRRTTAFNITIPQFNMQAAIRVFGSYTDIQSVVHKYPAGMQRVWHRCYFYPRPKSTGIAAVRLCHCCLQPQSIPVEYIAAEIQFSREIAVDYVEVVYFNCVSLLGTFDIVIKELKFKVIQPVSGTVGVHQPALVGPGRAHQHCLDGPSQPDQQAQTQNGIINIFVVFIFFSFQKMSLLKQGIIEFSFIVCVYMESPL